MKPNPLSTLKLAAEIARKLDINIFVILYRIYKLIQSSYTYKQRGGSNTILLLLIRKTVKYIVNYLGAALGSNPGVAAPNTSTKIIFITKLAEIKSKPTITIITTLVIYD